MLVTINPAALRPDMPRPSHNLRAVTATVKGCLLPEVIYDGLKLKSSVFRDDLARSSCRQYPFGRPVDLNSRSMNHKRERPQALTASVFTEAVRTGSG